METKLDTQNERLSNNSTENDSRMEKADSREMKPKDNEKSEMKMGGYGSFALMLAVSFVVMYIAMYLNTYALDHVYFSVTRFYMTFLMIAPMALIMLWFMRGMFKNKKINISIIAASVVVFVLALVFVRAQVFIGDSEYMKAMIPHHSIAIMTSRRANIKDPEVRKLADNIIEAQEREIQEMKQLLEKVK